ncbi:CRISPR-associated endonuclease Cas2 [Planktothrix serta]|uniref:CRISPR-associated endonuclease Cas2 n=1 Tax=Planktothrix serta TaxID=1678310 RepID=UPI0009F9FC45|nr:CRISPR-associated endonuclease Cas2 [Planktothrix serta]
MALRTPNFALRTQNSAPRTQNSAFECFISLEEMRQLHQKVKKLVLPQEDNVRFYWISNDALSIVLTIGSQKPEPPPQYYVI